MVDNKNISDFRNNKIYWLLNHLEVLRDEKAIFSKISVKLCVIINCFVSK